MLGIPASIALYKPHSFHFLQYIVANSHHQLLMQTVYDVGTKPIPVTVLRDYQMLRIALVPSNVPE
jgi:hypothetical protein